jgi:PAS domain S-box-containing protein
MNNPTDPVRQQDQPDAASPRPAPSPSASAQVEALQQERNLFRTILDNLPGIIFCKDREGRYILTNRAHQRVLGAAEEAILGKTGFDFHPPDLARQYQENEMRVMQSSEPIAPREEQAWHHEKGEKRWHLTNRIPLKNESGQVVGVVGISHDVTERKWAEEALRESQALYHSLVENLPAGVFRKNAEGCYVFVNSWFCRLKGVKAELFLGKKPQEVAAIELAAGGTSAAQINRLAAQGADHHQQIMQTGRPIEGEEQNVGPDGKEQYLHVVKSPIFDATGKVVGTQGIMFDITERKRAETALEESRRMLRSVLDTIPVRVFWKDAEGRYLGCNQSFARDAGFDSAEKVMGRNDYDMGWKAQAEQYRADDRQVITHGIPKLQYEEPQTTPTGTQLWLRTSKIPLRDLAGRVIGVLGTYEDITERKRADERIREQAALLDAANDAIYVRALDHTVTYWNDGAERLYERTRAEALGHKITELGEMDPGVFAAAHTVLLEQGSWSGELKKTTKAGKEITLFCRWTLLRDEQNRPKEVLAINSDITERKQLEANFLRAQRMEAIGALAGGIAHDLNNILQPILMTAPLLRETATDPENREMLDTVESCARRGGDIIRQLLTFARGTPGVRVPLPMRHLLRDMDKIIRETFPRNIQLHLDAPKELWPIMGDATQIHQALMNLCVNARDAMPDGGALTLAVENLTIDEAFATTMPDARPGHYVCVSVADTGAGIPPENLDRIFDPFFTTKEIGKGTGLGLATVLGIVRGHGGFVRVNSQIGKGTAFELYLPASAEAKPVTRSERVKLPPRAGGELILVVDDEAGVRGVIRRTLEKHGYQVAAAAEGAEALLLFDRHQTGIRAVLTDMMMPGMDGPSLVRTLRQRSPHLPIVGMTGVGEKADIKGLETLELVELLTKPFNHAVLLGLLHQVLAAPPKTKGKS